MTRRIPPVRRLLMDAKALIQKPENWCKRAFARDAYGDSVGVNNSRACRFCPKGALLNRNMGAPPKPYLLAYDILSDSAGRDIVNHNDADETTHPMIMRLFNKAIRRAKEQRI